MQNYNPHPDDNRYGQESGYDSAHPGYGTGADATVIDQAGMASYLAKVFGWMFLGLFLTAGTSMIVLSSAEIFYAVAPWVFPLLFAELGLVWYMSSRVNEMSATACTISFFVYSFFNGITLTPIVAQYTGSSVASVFMVTAGTFAIMALYGLTTKKDLTSWGSLLFMLLIGLILAMVVNIFMANGLVSMVLSCLGVFIFVGLTAYDAQVIKEQYINGMEYSEIGHKVAIMGALTLYLDFINLFLNLLRLFGNRD